MSDIVYFFKNNLYINLTNRCLVKCSYCIKYKWNFKFYGYDLKLKREPTFKEIIKNLSEKLKKYSDIKEVVFCGYGDPLLRWKEILKISKWIKNNYPGLKIRINTNGLADEYLKKNENVYEELKNVVDVVSISLNAHNERTFKLLHKTNIRSPFKKIISFIKKSKKYFPEVIITSITHPLVDIKKIKSLSKKLKVKFKEREYF
ncbi:MAG: TatD family nuclease-associated radical SAM protein [Endomicrobiia bacterium]